MQEMEILSLIAILSAGIAFISYLASKRSAQAAERSAEEASKARKVAQSELLSPHFHLAKHFLRALAGEQTNGTKLDESRDAILNLNGTLSNDNDTRNLLGEMIDIFNKDEIKKVQKQYRGNDSRCDISAQAPLNLNDIQSRFDQLSQKYIGIGP